MQTNHTKQQNIDRQGHSCSAGGVHKAAAVAVSEGEANENDETRDPYSSLFTMAAQQSVCARMLFA